MSKTFTAAQVANILVHIAAVETDAVKQAIKHLGLYAEDMHVEAKDCCDNKDYKEAQDFLSQAQDCKDIAHALKIALTER